MSTDLLRRVDRLEQISASQHNLIIDLLKREVTGPDVIKVPTGWHIRRPPAVSIDFAWVIIRQIDNAEDIKVWVEQATRGRNFSEAGADYGRYVGAFEYARTADPPPDPIPNQADFIAEMLIEPGRVAGEFLNSLWPFADEAGGWGDTDFDQTDILLALSIDGAWTVLMTPFRLAISTIEGAARAGDCVPQVTE